MTHATQNSFTFKDDDVLTRCFESGKLAHIRFLSLSIYYLLEEIEGSLLAVAARAKIPVSGAKVFKGNSWPSYLLALDYRCGGNPITLKECPKKTLKITPLENKNENEDPLKHGCLTYFLQFPWEGT